MGAKAKKVPVRMCVACRARKEKQALIRLVRLPENQGVALDPTGKKPGRGAYVCGEACLSRALKHKLLEKALQIEINPQVAAELQSLLAKGNPEVRE